MAASLNAMYVVEPIPDADLLYFRVHKGLIDKQGDVIHRAFQERCGGMSTNWAKYATPEETREQVVKLQKEPTNYGVVSFVAGDVRSISEATVLHTPIYPDNRSHTDINGSGPQPPSEYHTMVRMKLARFYSWCLTPKAP